MNYEKQKFTTRRKMFLTKKFQMKVLNSIFIVIGSSVANHTSNVSKIDENY